VDKQTVLSDYLATVSRKTRVTRVGEIMEQRNVGSVIVVEEGRPIGIITDRDLVLNVLNRGRLPDHLTAGEIMHSDPVTLPAGSDPSRILHTMVEHGIRRVPMVDDGELVDVVSLDDLLRLMATEMSEMSRLIETETPERFRRNDRPPRSRGLMSRLSKLWGRDG